MKLFLHFYTAPYLAHIGAVPIYPMRLRVSLSIDLTAPYMVDLDFDRGDRPIDLLELDSYMCGFLDAFHLMDPTFHSRVREESQAAYKTLRGKQCQT